jgi:hypothetical protein
VSSDRDQAGESLFLTTVLDPLVQEVLDAVEPWGAYDVANRIPGALMDSLDWLPHGGRLYTAWMELTDLFETGRTPIPDAHTALRRPATDWLARPGEPTGASIAMWLEQTQLEIERINDRDGTFWGPKE